MPSPFVRTWDHEDAEPIARANVGAAHRHGSSVTLAEEVISTFYIYVDGADLHQIAPELRARIESFVAPYGARVRVVDQREDDGDSSDMPAWDLGVNFEFESLTDAEKKDLLLFFHTLSGEFGRDFVLGGILPHGFFDDFLTVSATEPLDSAIELLTAHEPKG